MSSAGRMAAGAFIVFALGAAAAFVATGAAVGRPASYGTAGVSRPERAPLELVSLEHDRDGDRFIVRGTVRNPATAAVDGLVAAVSIFGRDGELIGSGHAAVEAREAGGRRRDAVCRHGRRRRGRRPLSSELPHGRRYRAAPRSTGARRAGQVVMKTHPMAPRVALAAAALVLAMAAVRAQNAESQGDAGVRFKSGVELVNVTATVSDSLGRFVPGLERDDFLVYEDNNPVEVLQFSAERVPVSLGIVLDTSGSMAGHKMEAARAALTRFTEELLDRADELFLYRFSNYPGAGPGVDERSPAHSQRARPHDAQRRHGDVRRRRRRDSAGAAGPEPQAGARRDLGRQRYGQPHGHPRPQAADSRERGPGVRRRDRRRRRAHDAPRRRFSSRPAFRCRSRCRSPACRVAAAAGRRHRRSADRAAARRSAGSTTTSTPRRCAR